MRVFGWFLLFGWLAILLTGCATPLAELRQASPVKAASFPGSYLPLATCAMEALESNKGTAEFVYRLVDRRPGQEAAVTGTVFDPWLFPSGAHMIDFAFKQTNAAVLVESRTNSGGGGWAYRARKVEERSWPLIERCAGKSAKRERR